MRRPSVAAPLLLLALGAAGCGTLPTPPVGAQPAAATRAYELYFGNPHAHSFDSDGGGAPAEHFRLAKANGYDFYALTDHALGRFRAMDAERWAGLRALADEVTDARFVAIAGFEFTENKDPVGTGHLNAWDTLDQLDASAPGVTLPVFLDWMEARARSRLVVAGFNHPWQTKYDRFKDFSFFTPERREVVALCEVINTSTASFSDYVLALDKGWRVAPSAALDNHGLGPITDLARFPQRTVILAPRLTRTDLLEAMKARRVYATWDTNLRLTYRANGQPMGSVLSRPAALTFEVEVRDPDTNQPADALTRLEIVSDGGAVVQVHEVRGHAASWRTTIDKPAGRYYLVRVFSADREDGTAFGAPVWLE